MSDTVITDLIADSAPPRRDHTTREALLIYLRVDTEPCPLSAIYRYMQMVHRVSKGVTRAQLRRLCNEGIAERVRRGMYRIAPGARMIGAAVRVNAASRDLILDYLDRCGERPVARIQAYMTTMHRVSAGATRTQLCRLVRAGRIERTGQDHYQLKAVVE